VASFDLDGEGQALLERVLNLQNDAERRHQNHRRRWEDLYGLYRGHQHFREWYHQASEPDRDTGLRDLKREWGAELFIPHSFETVEQVTPRAVSQLPVQPLGPRFDTEPENVENMRMLIEMQRAQIQYELPLQEVAKSGFIYGLGVMKGPFWRKDVRQGYPTIQEGNRHPWVQGSRDRVVFDDPDVEEVDIFDFFWDPFARSMRDCGWVIHRTWRSTDYCMRKLVTGGWSNPFGFPPSELMFDSANHRFDEAHRQRLQAAGHAQGLEGSGRNDVHEVWEFHDGGRKVVTILDRKAPVEVADAPAWHGELPFQAFRPTTSAVRELVGIGEIEPIRDLQIEMNTLRSQRRDNATLVLQRTFAYADGFVDPDQIRFGPGLAIPVNGDPRDLLFPIPVQDIPNSGYQEEAQLLADIERVTGLMEPGTSQSETATGAQIIHQAGSVRIQNKARRLMAEVVTPQTNQMVLLNQQHIASERQMWQEEQNPAQPGVRGAKWRQIQLGPAELAGDMFALPVDDASTMPDNVAQDREDGMRLWNAFANNQHVDQRELARRVAKLMGVKQPDRLLAPENRVPPGLVDILVQNGIVDEETMQKALEHAFEVEQGEQGEAQGAQMEAA
jgi:hypothetical protein